MYIEISKNIENKEARKLQRFLELKKFFCIPWILGHDKIFTKDDFLRNVEKHVAKKKNSK